MVEESVEAGWPNKEEEEAGCWPKRVIPLEDVDAGAPNGDGAELVTELEVWELNSVVPVALLVAVTDG